MTEPITQQRILLQLRTDRVINFGRAIVAAVLLVAIILDPIQPPIRQNISWILLIAYLSGSLLILWLRWHSSVLIENSVRISLHVFDVAVLSILVYLTGGSTRAAFGFYVYLLLAGHLGWRWRGTLFTAAGVLFLYLLGLAYSPNGFQEIDEVAARIGYFAVVSGILAYFGYAEAGLREQMLTIMEWPRLLTSEDAVVAYLERAARVLDSTSAALLWYPDRGSTADLVLWSKA